MSITLPQPVAAYFAADTRDGAAVARCFTPDAVVIDEQRTYAGRDAITAWKAETSAKFDYVSEPFHTEQNGDRLIVTSRVTGNFPGSPVDLRYGFVLEGDAIARLEIVP